MSLVLGRVEVEPQMKGGTVLWPRGTVPARPLESKSLAFHYSGEGIAEEEAGDPVLAAYDLPSAPPEWKPLRIDFESGAGVEVYDWEKGRWVAAGRLSGMSPEELSAFISPFDRVVIRRDQTEIFPALEVEGSVVP